MAKTYHCQIEVRGYELDSFGHVNHAVYLSYLEHARWKVLEQEGITLAKFQEWKRWPIIASIQADYLKPTFMGDILDIQTTAVEQSRVSFTFEQLVSRGDTVVFKGRVRVVTVNETGRPAEAPAEMARVMGGSA